MVACAYRTLSDPMSDEGHGRRTKEPSWAVVGGGERHAGGRPGARAGAVGQVGVGLGDRAQVAGKVVAVVGGPRGGDRAGPRVDRDLLLADDPVEVVVHVRGGKVVGDAARHPLGAGHLDHAPGGVVVELGLLALWVAGQRLLVHVVGERAGRPGAGVVGAEARADGLDQVVVDVVDGAGPDELAAVVAGGLGRALAAEPVEAVVVEETPVAAGTAAGVVGGLGDLTVGVGDPGRQPAGVVGVVRGGVVVGVGGRRERPVRVPDVGAGVVLRVGDAGEVAGAVVAEGPLEVVGHRGGGHALGVGAAGEQAQVPGGVGRVDRVVAVGEDGLAALGVGDVGEIAVGVVAVGGEHPRRLGDLAHLEVGGPGDPGALVERVGDLRDLAVGVVGVGGRPRQWRGHGGGLGDRVVGERGLVAQAVGAVLEPPAQLRP